VTDEDLSDFVSPAPASSENHYLRSSIYLESKVNSREASVISS